MWTRQHRGKFGEREGTMYRARTKGGKGNGLFPRSVQFEGEDFGVGLEVGVGGEDGPVAGEGDGADQDVGNGDGDSAGAAVVAGFGGGFIVGGGDGFIGEGTEDGPELFVLARGLDAGEQLLADQADDSGAALPNQVGEFGNGRRLGGIQVLRLPAQREGPNRSIDKNTHERFLVRSFL